MSSTARRASAVARAFLGAALAPVITLSVAGCARGETDYQPELSDSPRAQEVAEFAFAVHPLHNPERLFAVYGPIADYLSRHVPGVHFRLEASRDYGDFEHKLLVERSVQIALPNPYQTVRATARGYEVFGKMGDDENFRGIILVRRDSGIESVKDLVGKAVSYPAPTALAATMMPQYFLHTHGLDVTRDIRNLYVGSQESSILNVYHGLVAAGATWPVPWQAFEKEHPAEAKALVVKWQTETLPNNGLVARDDVPKALVTQIGELLFRLHTEAEGRAMLQRIPISRFEPATNATYEVVRTYVHRFSAEVRHVEE